MSTTFPPVISFRLFSQILHLFSVYHNLYLHLFPHIIKTDSFEISFLLSTPPFIAASVPIFSISSPCILFRRITHYLRIFYFLFLAVHTSSCFLLYIDKSLSLHYTVINGMHIPIPSAIIEHFFCVLPLICLKAIAVPLGDGLKIFHTPVYLDKQSSEHLLPLIDK